MSRLLRASVAATLGLASIVALAGVGNPARAAAPPPAPATLHVGSLTLTSCDVLPSAFCGTITRALDPSGAVAGTIQIGFAYVPASGVSAPTKSTVLPHEGGPGYATTASASYYSDMYGPLLATRNLLLIDQRGTGRSEPVNCKALQRGAADYAASVKKCGQSLGTSAYLYGTQLVADDESAVVAALDVGPVDVYGDSYGTFTAQVFASRHPSQVRSVIVDGAYPTYGEDAWYETQGPAMRTAFNRSCSRTPACAAVGGSTIARITQLLGVLRTAPITGTAPGADGTQYSVTLDASALNYLAFNAAYTSVTYRELDAGIRAYFDRGDTTPLLRLLAEAYYPGGGADALDAYSAGEYVAVSCQDYPRLYDLRSTPAQRQTQYTAAVNARIATKPDTYGPFSIQEYVDSYWSETALCLDWPTPSASTHIGPIAPPAGTYPSSLPMLVLSGEFDSLTTPAEGAMVASQWPNAQQIVVANSFHVTAMGDVDSCAEKIVRSFVTTPNLPVPTSVSSCAAAVPPVRATSAYRASSGQAPQATPATGSSTGAARLSAVTTTAETVADVLDRWGQTYDSDGIGLRGGTWSATGDGLVTFTLNKYRLVNDLAVSGTITWRRNGNHLVTVNLTTLGTTNSGTAVAGSPITGSLTGSWDGRAAGSVATLTGTLGGQSVTASLTAP
jgi:pimeloyl-ACP methyl ester carboxylesterase